MKALLFDIDGTLVRTGTGMGLVHREADCYAVKEMYGISITSAYLDRFGGMTDRRVITEALMDNGVDGGRIARDMPRIFGYTTRYFMENVGRVDPRECILPGVVDVLSELSGRKDCILGLVTGNVREIARMKLEALGIWRYFRIGGFGDASLVRAELIDAALEEARKMGLAESIEMRSVYVIGDTRHDIECAKERNAVSVAVSTGKYSKEELSKYGPDYLIGSLEELVPLIKSAV